MSGIARSSVVIFVGQRSISMSTSPLSTVMLRRSVGSSVFHDAETLIEIGGTATLAIKSQEDSVTFPAISREFLDENGNALPIKGMV